MGFRPLGVWRCLFYLFLLILFPSFSIFLPFKLNRKLIAGCMQVRPISWWWVNVVSFRSQRVNIDCIELNCITVAQCNMGRPSKSIWTILTEECSQWPQANALLLHLSHSDLQFLRPFAKEYHAVCGGLCSRHCRHAMRIPSIFKFDKIWKSFPRYCAILLEDQVACRGMWHERVFFTTRKYKNILLNHESPRWPDA